MIYVSDFRTFLLPNLNLSAKIIWRKISQQKLTFQLNSNGYTSQCTVTVNVVPPKKKKEISKVMRAYLERAQEHDQFMKVKEEEFRIGKRHLANMMGEDPETFTQEDVDVGYLFTSIKTVDNFE